MKTRDPDHPGAQGLSPIKPGTLCILVQNGWLLPEYVGRTVTAMGFAGNCPCGCPRTDGYYVTTPWVDGRGIVSRTALQPILPPGVDDQVERALGNPQLEVV